MIYFTIARPVELPVVITILLEGIDINHTDVEGRSILNYAALNTSTPLEVWHELWQEGANVNHMMPLSQYLEGSASVLECYIHNN